jgi:serine/threonine-protein kinase
MVAIPGGTFMMGRDSAPDPEETPAHSVTVGAFYLDKTPVTAGEYAAFTQASVAPGTEEWPATNVSWQEAQAYCAARGERLPTEAEWEFAARGTDGRLYPWGNNFAAALANSLESGLGRLQAAGAHRDAASPFGALGMSGNVWQWTADDYRPYPGRRAGFQIPSGAKVIRGGSYKSDEGHVTTTTRNLDHASTRSPVIGFRCAKSP